MLNEFHKNTRGKCHDKISIFNFDDSLLLHVFGYLSVRGLLCVSRVCRQWNRVAADGTLWRNVDLKPFHRQLGKENRVPQLDELIASRLSTVFSLDLSGFTLASRTLTLLHTTCKNLRKLILKAVTFRDSFEYSLSVPDSLEYLDVRFSNGSSRVFLAIARSLSKTTWLGMCDGLIYSLSKHGELEAMIERCRKSLRVVDMSQCYMAKDNLVGLLSSCENLEVLNLRKCSSVGGDSINYVLGSCKSLKTLILDGTLVSAQSLSKMRWDETHLCNLELGCVPFIPPKTLKVTLLQIFRNSSLRYLGLCCTGNRTDLMADIFDCCACAQREVRLINLCTTQSITNNKTECETGYESRQTLSLILMCPALKRTDKAVSPQAIFIQDNRSQTSVNTSCTKRFLDLSYFDSEHELETAL